MAAPLNEFERRVLGCLLEKQMTVPDAYPMTENALVSACNQKSNRDPVMELDGEAVWEALESLREKGLVTTVLPGPEARTKRYKHEVEAVYSWQKRERAIMTELLLRGPQTPGELRGRCNRFVPFENVEAVMMVLDCLMQASPPWVKTMPREPGQSATRYMHLLYPEEEMPAVGAAPEAPAARVGVRSVQWFQLTSARRARGAAGGSRGADRTGGTARERAGGGVKRWSIGVPSRMGDSQPRRVVGTNRTLTRRQRHSWCWRHPSYSSPARKCLVHGQQRHQFSLLSSRVATTE